MSQVASTDELVTKTDLATFYQGILPYLGGMPEMVANKFTKSDLYSTDEKIIGQWIDGKPLYQKTIVLNNPSGAWSPISLSSYISNDCNVTYKSAYIVTTGNVIISEYYDTTSDLFSCVVIRDPNGTLGITTNWVAIIRTNHSISKLYLTLQYTKTTDSAISMGNDTDYSTTEKIIGTWVDGKPIYQKTVDCGALPKNTTKTVSIGVVNIDNVKNIYGYGYAPSANRCIDLPYSDSAHSCLIDIRDLSTTPYIRLVSDSDFSTFTESYVTIQYTKSTD